MKIKDFFSSLSNKKKILIGIGGLFLIAVVAGATFLPGTLFKGDSSKYPWVPENNKDISVLLSNKIEKETENKEEEKTVIDTSKLTKNDVDLKESATKDIDIDLKETVGNKPKDILQQNTHFNIVDKISSPTTNPSPSFSVKSSIAGDLSYEGACGDAYDANDKVVNYINGNNKITQLKYKDLAVGTYYDCKIILSWMELNGSFFENKTESLYIPKFEVKALPPAQQQKGSINTSSDLKSSLDNATFNTDNLKSTKNKEKLTCEGKLKDTTNNDFVVEWSLKYTVNEKDTKINATGDPESGNLIWSGKVGKNGKIVTSHKTTSDKLPLTVNYPKKDFINKEITDVKVTWDKTSGTIFTTCSPFIFPKDDEKKDEDTLLETIPVKDKTLKEEEKSDSKKLNATCSISPNPAKVGEDVTFKVDATGGDGKNYSYYWLVDLNGNQNKQSFTHKFDKIPTNTNFQVLVRSDKEFSVAECPELKFTTVASSDDKKTEEKKEEKKEEEKDTKIDLGVLSKCPGVYYPSDIEGHWAEPYIKQGYDKCLFKGIDGKFYPDRSATRIESSSMILYALNKKPVTSCTTSSCSTPFKDLQSIDQGAILNPLYFGDLVEGYPNNTFAPQSLITRAEASALIVKAFFAPFSRPCADPHCGAGWPDNFFLDINDTWQGRYIRVLWDNDIMTGTGKNKVEPNRNITRAEMAKMIVIANDKLKK